MKGISGQFCDWARARLVEKSDGVLSEALIFDERRTDLSQAIMQAVNSKLGCCVAMRAPRLQQVGDRPDDTQYNVVLDIAILHNAALNPKLDSVLFSEHLFMSFAGELFATKPIFPVNVKADGLSHDLSGTKWVHTFSISYIETL